MKRKTNVGTLQAVGEIGFVSCVGHPNEWH